MNNPQTTNDPITAEAWADEIEVGYPTYEERRQHYIKIIVRIQHQAMEEGEYLANAKREI